MSNPTFGIIEDFKVYDIASLAKIFGLSDRRTKEIVRDNVEHCDMGGGRIFVSGLNFRLAIERMSTLGSGAEPPYQSVTKR